MKWIHTADWHLGKIVHGRHMTEDQRIILFESFLQIVDEEQPDAIIVAGDLYDRSVPPVEAVDLLDEMWKALVLERNIPVLAIAGNHDSAERLQYSSKLLTKVGLHIVGKYEPGAGPIIVAGIPFYLMPFLEPARIRYTLQDETIRTHHDALTAVVESFGSIDARAVGIGHSFVAGGLETDSERQLSVGTAGQVAKGLYEPFGYTALGHLHNRDALRNDKIAYSGSLMKYSFSEANHVKSVDVIEWDGGWTRRRRPLQARRDLRILTGTLNELLDPVFYQDEKTDDYLKIVLTDESALFDPMAKLRTVYPNILHLELELLRRQDETSRFERETLERQSIEDVYMEFFKAVHGRDADETVRRFVEGDGPI
ncbi:MULTISPECIES: exonuclease SbcCD subunit D [unclassified Exiguobacterium]|uniref:exonuclease SbcCD subunit D n=1 Tax=unclassified Exiguobacterium TaxID=2644629 RepID=UPI0010403D9F|nr:MULTISPECIES: exonuclease SbcCD subunit D [unclassified Exiguobacterium]TCI39767.1 exonuclease SbcCD subunit D [Exiguobacterium sp. SH4S7]TCI47540.1 exonuclease SbcCD subunit D [Exiguobacterium sp. SH5S32]TCI54424.1 exonuclease SbcCD subunit D [Exiguobacterium sp. SH1S4]TCI74217.1 exonuclease SbcCD subunit D [Exiguobacterium sp. SH1S1]